ncbi:MAG: hypothetical protein NT129_02965 [Candidatus Aenigmarchaeota archaeon]|nr:hypothetical protein [Candidatus Aenigmarchaeota archaeon]
MNPLLSMMLLLLIAILAIAVVLSAGQSVIDKASGNEKFREAADIMKFIDNSISSVAEEGAGAKRILKFSSPGDFETIPRENALQFHAESSVLEYLSRKIIGNLVYISGNDVSCYSGSDLTMENSYLKAVFKKVDPMSAINTENNIVLIKEKTLNTEIYPTNSSVVIDDNPATASGIGYSEILKTGSNLPACSVHFFVNSTVSYDIYYTLYAGADFLAVEVRNLL